jgi:flagellar basal-body rod modification protein FlgD
MSVTSVTSSTPSPAILNGQQVTGTTRIPTKVLGQQDFLTLLAKQFQTQDPMKPMDDTSFIAQMAQFTSLQQMTQLSQSQQMMTGNSYLGLNVTVQDPASGQKTTGVVSAIDNSGATPALVINGTSYPLSQVKNIQLPPTAAGNVPSAAAPATSG